MTAREHILFVDDEKILTDVAEEIFYEFGYQVSSFNHPLDALKAFEEQPYSYDIVISDQTMPILGGLELAKKMLKIRPNIPIILCTGYSRKVDQVSAMEAGIREFAVKPLRYNEMAEIIRQLLHTST